MTLIPPILRPAGPFDPTLARSILITNIMAAVLAAFTLSLLIFYSLAYGFLPWYLSMPVVAGLFLFTIVLNQKGLHFTGRMTFCLIPVTASLILSIYSKSQITNPTFMGYFDARYFMLTSVVLPGIVFRFQEKKWLIGAFLFSFAALMAFDPIHNLFHIGFYQRGFQSPFYYYINYIVFLTYATLMAGILILKWLTERAESAAVQLLAEKDKANHDLEQARIIIEQQHNAILTRNESLEEEVERRTRDLMEYTHQLEQFAFISSHNLRAPVARILGLGHLLELPVRKPEDEAFILSSLIVTARELDRVVTDLNTILAIRSADHSEQHDIDLWDELRLICAILSHEIEETHAEITLDFSQGRVVRSIKSYVNAMLTQLVSNAIRFRHPDRPPVIALSTRQEEGYFCITVKDNGLGIDLDLHREKLFTLYSRFHPHIEGKGLGLHLLKTQIYSLGGKVTVESQAGEGSTFTLFFEAHQG